MIEGSAEGIEPHKLFSFHQMWRRVSMLGRGVMGLSEFDACSATLAVARFKRYKQLILTTKKTCTLQTNCCAKKYPTKCGLSVAYSMNNRKRQQ